MQIDTAVDGADLVGKVATYPEYRVVITDFQMPRMNGMEATKRIRELGYSGPILLTTSLGLENLPKEELTRNGIEYVEKSPRVWSEITGKVLDYLSHTS